MRIVVLGYVVRYPLGGMVWHHLQYVLGLSRLGHDVFFIEDSGDDPWACYNPATHVTGPDPAFGLEFASRVFNRTGLGDRWAYHDALAGRWSGPLVERVADVCASAELLLNLSGANVLRAWALQVPARVYIDTDPAFTQLRHVLDPVRKARTLHHTDFFSFGENIGVPCCGVPDDGIAWLATRQPVVLDAWRVNALPHAGRLTTVLQWDDDSTLQGVPLEYGGRSFGRKRASFAAFAGLPRRVVTELELAIGGAGVPMQELRDNGWHLRSALEVTKDPWIFQNYVRESIGEFSIAKQGYVASKCGWFSERSTGYLASGRPVIVQDTGFSSWLKTDVGVLRFGDVDDAVAAIDDLRVRYTVHQRAARDIVAGYFASDRVLSDLLARVKP